MCSESFWSLFGSGLSSIRKIRSNLDRIAFEILMLPFMSFCLLFAKESTREHELEDMRPSRTVQSCLPPILKIEFHRALSGVCERLKTGGNTS